jgi:hypothetical protein
LWKNRPKWSPTHFSYKFRHGKSSRKI